MKITDEHESFGVKNITTNLGIYSLNAGTNTLYFNYKNADSGNDADFDAIIIEHQADSGDGFGKIKNITVKEFRDISGEEGMLQCDFEVIDPNSKIDIYFVSNIDSMSLLSDKEEL